MAAIIDTALRGLQIVFAIVVIGTVGYGIHLFKPFTLVTDTPFGQLVTTYHTPASWGFLVFCAVWTFLVAGLVLSFRKRIAGNRLAQWACIAIECVALLSWLAGFIAVAVNLATDICPKINNNNNDCCTPVAVAAAFGAFEWLFFVATTIVSAKDVFGGGRQLKE